MSTCSAFQTSSKAAALRIIQGAPETAQLLESTLQQSFPPTQTLSVLRTNYTQSLDLLSQPNETLANVIHTTMDATERVLSDMATLTQYVTLSIPKMEDGGNWGVSVQLAALKAIADYRERLEKCLEEISKYFSVRAEALEKCKLPSQSKSITTTQSKTDSNGTNTEKGDVKLMENKTMVEEKETQTLTNVSLDLEHRKQAVLAVDLLYYQKAKSLFQLLLTAYLGAVDFADKNSDKLAYPKGSSGGSSSFASMY